jgi:4-hydroxy-tetrahydrodipicolinate synthase
MNTLFCEVNPVPVKAASVLMDICGPEIRLPLCEMEPANLEKLKNVMKEYGLI